MLFGKPRTVQVSTRAELDAALVAGTTDKIVVQGDAGLLRYAEEIAGNDPDVTVRTETETTTTLVDPISRVNRGIMASPVNASAMAVGPDAKARLTAPEAAEYFPYGAKPTNYRKKDIKLVVVFGIVVALVFAGFLLQFDHTSSSPSAPSTPLQSPRPIPPSPPAFLLEPHATHPDPRVVVPQNTAPAIDDQHSTTQSSVAAELPGATWKNDSNIPVLTWAAVALAAIVALYLIARQAIAGGQNVEISWKVTSKVEGKVIISRVQPRRERQAKAA